MTSIKTISIFNIFSNCFDNLYTGADVKLTKGLMGTLDLCNSGSRLSYEAYGSIIFNDFIPPQSHHKTDFYYRPRLYLFADCSWQFDLAIVC